MCQFPRSPLYKPTGPLLLLATVPTALFLLCHDRLALADDYFDPAALEVTDPQQKTADLHYFEKMAASSPVRTR